MAFLDWVAIVIGVGLIFSGARAVRCRMVKVPEIYEGARAVRIGWLWICMGTLFVLAVIFDIGFLKFLFRLFLEAPN
jgi:hypothetical protein